MNQLLVVGNDKIGRRLIAQLKRKDNLYVIIDASANLKRVFKLIKRGSIKPSLLVRMALAEFLRQDYDIPRFQRIYSNSDLLKGVNEHEIDRVYLFRAGLIINQKVIESGVEILNVHCARISGYGGLGSIMRALEDGAYEQEATLHRVTAKIDEGEVLATVPYRLSKALSYRQNEEIAYDAGIQLLLDQLGMIEK